ncbi:MAG: hypothetical protein NVS3B25_24600 [Hymenobacter sp.]
MSEEQVLFEHAAREVLALLTKHRRAWESVYPKMTRDFHALQSALDGVTRSVPHSSESLLLARRYATEASLPLFGGVQALSLDGHHPGLRTLAAQTRPSLDALEHTRLLDLLHELYFRTLPLMDELEAELVTYSTRSAFEVVLKAYARALEMATRTNDVTLVEQHIAHHLHAAAAALVHLDARVPLLERCEPQLVANYQRLRQGAPDKAATPVVSAAVRMRTADFGLAQLN